MTKKQYYAARQKIIEMEQLSNGACGCGRGNHCEHVIDWLSFEEYQQSLRSQVKWEIDQLTKLQTGVHVSYCMQVHVCCKCRVNCVWDEFSDAVWRGRGK